MTKDKATKLIDSAVRNITANEDGFTVQFIPHTGRFLISNYDLDISNQLFITEEKAIGFLMKPVAQTATSAVAALFGINRK